MKLEDAVSTEISVMYYSVDDKTGEKVEMSAEEIDETIAKNIEEGDIEYEDENNQNLITEFLTGIGIFSTEVKAASKTDSDTKISTSGALKQYLICSQTKKGGTIFVTYTATWLDEAYYRNKDVCGVTVSNAVINRNSWSCDHWATYSFTNYKTGKTSTQSLHSKPNAYTISDSGSGVCYTVNLWGDRTSMNAVVASGAGVEHYKNEFITIKFNCEIASKKTKYVTFTSRYAHSETNKSISPSISLSSGGLSVAVSGSKTNYYNIISRNAYLPYKYI